MGSGGSPLLLSHCWWCFPCAGSTRRYSIEWRWTVGLDVARCKFCGGSQHGRHCLLRVSVDPRALQHECPVGKKLLWILQRLVIVTFPQGVGSSGVRAIRSFPVCLWWVSNFGVHDCLGSRWDPIF
ncbi:uncharacterized protein TEOVI_000867900 [Trypanosoma equiperdum]|uniref:Uncharacterized protein n=2 Tax=Trypanozoon TaxID=39700 RepID=Q38C75_TRYB2|nr:hypothetical protein Tb10.70.6250 [Trypanosoma brucei brucei TREU927]EAN77595.1 hypothetical protein Tb10.70.6250 [Trypanosoma brucei brucei TREU927]SCU67015.1 hypothetical protein, conserved [Trypanosoma equiperdum]